MTGKSISGLHFYYATIDGWKIGESPAPIPPSGHSADSTQKNISVAGFNSGLRLYRWADRFAAANDHGSHISQGEVWMSNNFGIKSFFISGVMLVAVALTAMAAGRNLRDQIVFGQEIVVNGAKVKPGTYELRFDAEASELTILKENKVVATTRVTVQSGQKPERQTTIYLTSTGQGTAGMTLSRVIFRKDDRVLVITPEAR
jgi:hypothetical protein